MGMGALESLCVRSQALRPSWEGIADVARILGFSAILH